MLFALEACRKANLHDSCQTSRPALCKVRNLNKSAFPRALSRKTKTGEMKCTNRHFWKRYLIDGKNIRSLQIKWDKKFRFHGFGSSSWKTDEFAYLWRRWKYFRTKILFTIQSMLSKQVFCMPPQLSNSALRTSDSVEHERQVFISIINLSLAENCCRQMLLKSLFSPSPMSFRLQPASRSNQSISMCKDRT